GKTKSDDAAAGSPYRILSIDGGGLRGIVPLAVLENLDRKKPGWRDGINMFAGTSTGGLIALALASGMQPREIMDAYLNQGPAIFERSLWHEIKTLDEAVGPKYDSKNRESVCHSLLKDARLADYVTDSGMKGHVLIAAFDIDDKVEPDPRKRRWRAKLFHNMPTKDGSDDGGEIAYRVAMRTSAAPTYFASYDGFIDGGVFANNISMCAVAQTQDARNVMSIPLSSVRLLSLGTGYASEYIDGEENWGLAQWAPRLVDVLTDGVLGVADYQTLQMLGAANYCRLTTEFNQPIAMDDPSQIGILQRIGDAIDVDPAVALITRW
ncbi:MAG TPA: patatin-like phospholipase family protein, partial [Rudaea sp.]|nr:patatin-like phospholipase family protein [Rudaea sp.]